MELQKIYTEETKNLICGIKNWRKTREPGLLWLGEYSIWLPRHRL